MRFEHPNLFWLLLIPPAMFLLFWFANRQKQKLLAQFISARLLPVLTTGISPARQKLRFAFLIIAVAFLIVALARPQYGFDLEEVQQNGLDIVVAVDTSKSMLTTDIAPNRLERAKLAALELMQRAGTDRLGLVAFAGDAFLECPLTIDNTAFQQSVQALNVNSIPQGGTAIAEAINTALTAFKEKGHHRALVLLTDGEDNDSETGALEAAQNAAKDGLKIFTIGIGTAAGDLIRVTDANGNSDYVRDEQGNVVKSHLNENLLQQIAGATGGFYLPLRGADTMDTLYERGLEPLPKLESSEKLIRRYHEQFQWPLGAVILFLLAEMFLPERKREKKTVISAPKNETAKTAVLAMILCVLPNFIFASPADALREYNVGKYPNYTNALQEYERLSQIYTNDLRLVFNAGAAAYRATNFDTAQNFFQQVTLSPDLKLQQQAYYNLGNVQFQMAKQAKDLDGLEQGFDAAAKIYERAVAITAALLRAKGSADVAVQRAEFHRALEIMQGLAQNYKIAEKQFEEFTKKLKDIDDIATPNQK
jgi:Ca-activated chloride channel family protein